MKKVLTLLFLKLALVSYSQTTLISPTGEGGFENATSTLAANNWIAIGATAPTWFVGTAAGSQGGTKAAFIGVNATTFTSSGGAATVVNHFYRDVVIPAGATQVYLNYYLKYLTPESGYEFFYVFTTTTANTPVAGVVPSTGYTQQFMNTATAYTSFTAMPQVDLSALAGTTVRLVFTFKKTDEFDPDGVAAVDNISLVYTPGCTAPTTQASAFVPSAITQMTMTIGWTRGNGTNVLVIARAGSPPTDPINGTTYTGNSAYGSGTPVGGGFSVYDGPGTSVNLTALTTSTVYYFAIYERTNTGTCYNLNELTGNATTDCAGTPSVPTSSAGTGISTNSFIANWASSTGATSYFLDVCTDAGFTAFVAGYNNLNVGNVVSFNVSGLAQSTTYYYRVRANNACGASASSSTQTVTTISFYKIPVIVHIVHNGEAVGTGLNISQAQVQSQIDRLNLDFRKKNSDTTIVPAVWKPLVADAGIEFCLAKANPSDVPLSEPGIDRINRSSKAWSAPPYTTSYIDATIKPNSYWDPTKYMNIWVTNISGGTIGYSQFPGGPANKDGIVVGYTYFGSVGPVSPPLHLGRSAVGLTGLWLGLQRLWAAGSCSSDGIADTPPQSGGNFGCPSFPLTDACSPTFPGIMFMNYMDYTDDACMAFFTKDQATAMRQNLTTYTNRMELLSSNKCSGCSPSPQLSGTYTIGGASPDYATISTAVADLNSCGISGPVVFNVRNGTYTEQITIGSISGTNSSDTIVFQSENLDSSLVSIEFNANITNKFTIKLDNADYITFRHLTIKSLNSLYAFGIQAINDVDNFNLLNCKLEGPLVVNCNTFKVLIESDDSDHDFWNIQNNYFLNSSSAFEHSQATSSYFNISKNHFQNQSCYQIFLSQINYATVKGNYLETSSTNTNQQMMFFSSVQNAVITDNQLEFSNFGGAAIYIANAGNIANYSLLANNVVIGNSSNTVYGIHMSSSRYVNVYHNSVQINSSNSNSASLYFNSGNVGNVIGNNIFSNLGIGYAVDAPSNAGWTTVNNNNYYSLGANLGRWSAVNQVTLTDWKTASGQDANSVSVDPLFVSSNDLHLKCTSPAGLQNGQNLASVVPIDMDGETRATTPWMGADEYIPPPMGNLRYWVGGAGNWNDNSHWATITNGCPNTSVPTTGNDVYFDSNSFSGPGQIITVPAGNWYMQNIQFLDVNKTPQLVGPGSLIIGP